MALLLDTNIISRLRRLDRAPVEFGQWAETMDLDSAYLSVITLMEMEDGILSAQRKDPAFAAILRGWQQNILAEFAERIVPIDTDIAIRFSHLKKIRSAQVTDGLIAATALERNFALVTHNVRHFVGFGLELIDPIGTPPATEP